MKYLGTGVLTERSIITLTHTTCLHSDSYRLAEFFSQCAEPA